MYIFISRFFCASVIAFLFFPLAYNLFFSLSLSLSLLSCPCLFSLLSSSTALKDTRLYTRRSFQTIMRLGLGTEIVFGSAVELTGVLLKAY